jgi:hypothetical protein
LHIALKLGICGGGLPVFIIGLNRALDNSLDILLASSSQSGEKR